MEPKEIETYAIALPHIQDHDVIQRSKIVKMSLTCRQWSLKVLKKHSSFTIHLEKLSHHLHNHSFENLLPKRQISPTAGNDKLWSLLRLCFLALIFKKANDHSKYFSLCVAEQSYPLLFWWLSKKHAEDGCGQFGVISRELECTACPIKF